METLRQEWRLPSMTIEQATQFALRVLDGLQADSKRQLLTDLILRDAGEEVIKAATLYADHIWSQERPDLERRIQARLLQELQREHAEPQASGEVPTDVLPPRRMAH